MSQFWCWNKECPDCENKARHIVIKQKVKTIMHFPNAGHARITLANKRYNIFGLATSKEEVLRTFAMIPEKGNIRGVARTTVHNKDTVSKWFEIAATQELTKYFLQNINFKRIGVDKI